MFYTKVSTSSKITTVAFTGVLLRKYVLKDFAKFTGKHPCWSVSFNKVEGLRPAALKKRL